MDLCKEIVYDVTSLRMICDAIQDVKHYLLGQPGRSDIRLDYSKLGMSIARFMF
jgi:hypothetical protein